MRRIARTVGLRPEHRREYLDLHTADTHECRKPTAPCQEPWPDRGTWGQWPDLPGIRHLGESDPESPADSAEASPGPRSAAPRATSRDQERRRT